MVGAAQAWEDEIVRRVEAVAEKRGWLMSQVALFWVSDKAARWLIGSTSVGHLGNAVIFGSNPQTRRSSTWRAVRFFYRLYSVISAQPQAQLSASASDEPRLSRS